jgi:hypothetical protein
MFNRQRFGCRIHKYRFIQEEMKLRANNFVIFGIDESYISASLTPDGHVGELWIIDRNNVRYKVNANRTPL